MNIDEYNREKGRREYKIRQYESQITDLTAKYERLMTAYNSIEETRSVLYNKYQTEYASFGSVFEDSIWYGTEAAWWNSNFLLLHNDTLVRIDADISLLKESILSNADTILSNIEALEEDIAYLKFEIKNLWFKLN